MPARVTLGALVADRNSSAPSRCRLLRGTFLGPSQYISIWNYLMTLCFLVWDRWLLRAEPMPSCRPNLLFFGLFLFSIFLPSGGSFCGVGVFRLTECATQNCTADSFMIIIIISIIVAIVNQGSIFLTRF